MLVTMVKVGIVGTLDLLDDVLETLYRLAAVQLVDVTDVPDLPLPPLDMDEEHRRELEQLRSLRARTAALVETAQRVGLPTEPGALPAPVDVGALAGELDDVLPRVQELSRRLDDLASEAASLPGYLDALERLLPLLPSRASTAGYETIAVLVEARHAQALADLATALEEAIGSRFEIVSDRLDRDTIGSILIVPRNAAARAEALLGRQQVGRVRLPERFERLDMVSAADAIRHRLGRLPGEMESVRGDLRALVGPVERWVALLATVDARLDQLRAVERAGGTRSTFAFAGWVPAPRLEEVIGAVETLAEGRVLVRPLPPRPDDRPPVLLRNVAPVRPFEGTVSLYALPRYGTLDPTWLVALFMPLFFGMMLGDVAYGLAVVALAAWLRRRWGPRSAIARDVGTIGLLAGSWAVLWGVVYGELLGDLGERLGLLHPLWIDRQTALGPLLVFSVTLGAAHVVLGLFLGIGGAWRHRHLGPLAEGLGRLVALAGLFGLAAVVAGRLPAAAVTPASAAVIVGVVLLAVPRGFLGLLLGPLELVGTVGNVLSYLRIAAIGLASVYLARVANELGGLGPLWMGLVVAALFHALNLVLGVFSPTIQALRLHYVEFFGRFFEEGGEPFRPFGCGASP